MRSSRKRGFNDCILGNNGLKTGISNTIIEVKNQTSNDNLGVNSPWFKLEGRPYWGLTNGTF